MSLESAPSESVGATVAAPRDEYTTSPRTRLKNKARKAHRERYWAEHDKETYVCPMCDRRRDYYEVHHIDGDWLNGHAVNLVALCYPCHKLRHGLPRRVASVNEWKAELETLGGDGE